MSLLNSNLDEMAIWVNDEIICHGKFKNMPRVVTHAHRISYQ